MEIQDDVSHEELLTDEEDEEAETTKKSGDHKCKKCDYVGNTRASLYCHTFEQHNPKPFKCLECDFETRRFSMLRSHRKETGCNGYECNECVRHEVQTDEGINRAPPDCPWEGKKLCVSNM